MSDDILVSIFVPVYNHEKYIKQCLNGILKQKVNFKYEVLIGEDCSTDSSRKILKDMELKLPNSFKIFYREKNLGTGKQGNIADLHKRAVGKYWICCEGDDFWISENKLQMQVDFLETHNDYIAIAHECFVVDAKGNVLKEKYPSCKDKEYSFERFMAACMPGQTATILYRRSYFEINQDFTDNFQKYHSFPGDRKKAFLLLCHGKVRCIHQKMSAYRHVIQGGNSFSATMYDWDKYYYEQFLFYDSIFCYAKSLNNPDAIRVSAKLYYYSLIKYSVGKKKKYKLRDSVTELCKEVEWKKICVYIVKRFIVTIAYFKLKLPVRHEKYFV